eukprot:g30764.t1
MSKHATLVFSRHGESEWNVANIFTGWVDVDLSEKGLGEAKGAGELLKAEGLEIDVAYTSFLKRRSARCVLEWSAGLTATYGIMLVEEHCMFTVDS